MLRLEVHHKTQGSYVFESEKSAVFIGRDRSMDLILDDPLVSRQHAVIIARGGTFILQDIGARNPVRVNGQEVVSQVLRAGDRVELGDTVLCFLESEVPGGRGRGEPTPAWAEPRAGAVPETTQARGIGAAGPPGGSGERRSQRNLRILENFCGIVRSLSGQRSDRKRLLEMALDTVFENLDVKRGFIGFFSPSGDLEIEVERNQEGEGGTSYSRTFVERVRKEGVAFLFSDAADETERSTAVGDSKSVVRLNIKSAMCLPLFRTEDSWESAAEAVGVALGGRKQREGDQVTGVLYLDNRGRSESFTQEDLYFANILSHMISIAVEKEELYERIRQENIELRTILQEKNRLVGVSPAFEEVLRKVKRVAGFDTTVLIAGESGTGKELVARAIHDRSPRRGNPFIAVNCAAIPETLLESELFGYAPKSGISGSDPKGKPGKFELAHGGTLFLDEIGDMSLSTQAKILRVLEDKVVERLGAKEGVRVDLRIVAATNKVLEKCVREGTFREDLYYRLKVFTIDIPPLRERREDILPLAEHFLSAYAKPSRSAPALSPRAKELLLAYHWPGNVRELKNCIEQAVLLAEGRVIYPEHLPSDLRRSDIPAAFETLAEVEAQHIRRVLQNVNWNKRRAAEVLGINRSTLYEKIRVYGLERDLGGEAAGSAAADAEGEQT